MEKVLFVRGAPSHCGARASFAAKQTQQNKGVLLRSGIERRGRRFWLPRDEKTLGIFCAVIGVTARFFWQLRAAGSGGNPAD